MAVEFVLPDFIAANDPEEIQARMMENLPAGIDKTPGGFPYDFTMPTALEKSELIQFHLIRTLMLMFPEWAWGEYLDLHGKQAGLARKEEAKASGKITVEGVAGTILPLGFEVCTQELDLTSSVKFTTDKEYVIPQSGFVTIDVEAVLSGKQSNVNALTVTMMSNPVEGIFRVFNKEEITGGSEAEGDEEFRQRIIEANQSRNISFLGNDSDYIRWAKQVKGVGNVVIVPEWDGPGTVKVVLTDKNGGKVEDKTIKAVYDYIVSPEDRLKRLAPIGATVTVAHPQLKEVHYAAKLVLKPGYDLQLVKASFMRNLEKLYEISKEEHMIKYNHANSFLVHTEGVFDFQDFTIEGKTENIPLATYEYPSSNLDNIKEG